MTNSTKTTIETDHDGSELSGAAEFARKTEAEFAVFTQEALKELLIWVRVKNARIETFRYDGAVLDKPGLRIRIGDTEFQVLFIKV